MANEDDVRGALEGAAEKRMRNVRPPPLFPFPVPHPRPTRRSSLPSQHHTHFGNS